MSRRAIIAEARRWIGTPYRHQASLKGIGCDCLGLIRGIWRARIGPEPEAFTPYAPDWAEAGGEETLYAAASRHCHEKPLTEREPGDLLLFRWRAQMPAKHCGILSGSAAFIHAHDGASVAEVPFSPWWQRHLAFVFAFPER